MLFINFIIWMYNYMIKLLLKMHVKIAFIFFFVLKNKLIQNLNIFLWEFINFEHLMYGESRVNRVPNIFLFWQKSWRAEKLEYPTKVFEDSWAIEKRPFLPKENFSLLGERHFLGSSETIFRPFEPHPLVLRFVFSF